MKGAYYNEVDPFAAQWLRNLIAEGLIAPGEVDERDIRDVVPTELAGFRQCHFFAGIGGWSYALRLAGWSDDEPCWTGSCPCQPFSAAGRGGGFADERHLWPAWFHILGECRPAVVFGEQVASKDGLGWLDRVFADLEGAGYACGAADLCAAGVGAPHIRQRLFFVADTEGPGSALGDSRRGASRSDAPARWRDAGVDGGGAPSGLADADHRGSRQRSGRGAVRPGGGDDACGRFAPLGMADPGGSELRGRGQGGCRCRPLPDPANCGAVCRVAHAGRDECRQGRRRAALEGHAVSAGSPEQPAGLRDGRAGAALGDTCGTGLPPREREAVVGAGWREARGTAGEPSGAPVAGFWAGAEWLPCSDGKARPVEPGAFPLANGLPAGLGRLQPELRRLAEVAGLSGRPLTRAKGNRVGRLRGYGNAIVAEVAAEFIAAYRESLAARGAVEGCA